MSAQSDRVLRRVGSPLCDPATLRIDDMLDNEPAERRWLLQDVLPIGVVGLLAAGGGTGKSFLTLQLAVAVATGQPFLGMPIEEPGGVLVIAAEDERDELQRRLRRIVEAEQREGRMPAEADRRLRHNLSILASVGADNRLTAEQGGMIVRTDLGQRISSLAKELPALKLIVLDPVSRFRGGDENANDAATRFVEAVETLRSDTGATILLPHHVSKNGLRSGTEGISVENLRGASALVDGVRWASAMATMRTDEASKLNVDKSRADFYVRFETVKNNYAPPWPGMWLERQPGGVLAPVKLQASSVSRQKAKNENDYRTVLPRLISTIEQAQEAGRPLTRNKLRDYAGASSSIGISDKPLRRFLNRAISEGHIVETTRRGGRGKELRIAWVG